MTTRYVWEGLYEAAILETDDAKLPQHIRAAKAAIDMRLQEMQRDHGGAPEERQAIADALSGLNVLRTRGWKTRQQVPKLILIVDDSPVVRKTLRQTLERQPGWEVCGEAADGREAIEKAQQLKPNLVVLDLSMPVMNGLDAARELKRLLPALLLVMFTSFKTAHLIQEALSAGVSSVVPKSEPAGLVANIHALLLEPVSWELSCTAARFPGTLGSWPQVVDKQWIGRMKMTKITIEVSDTVYSLFQVLAGDQTVEDVVEDLVDHAQ
jgi:CheY-like chemotaxis protein